MNNPQGSITILVVKQDETPTLKTIPNTLKAKQSEVGGYIEPFELKDGTTIYCNEEGKTGSWRLNRAIRACDINDSQDGRIVEMMAGTFIISGFDPITGMDVSLTEEQSDYWGRRFHMPETLIRTSGGKLLVMPVAAERSVK